MEELALGAETPVTLCPLPFPPFPFLARDCQGRALSGARDSPASFATAASVSLGWCPSADVGPGLEAAVVTDRFGTVTGAGN